MIEINNHTNRHDRSFPKRIGNVLGTVGFYGQILKETFLTSSINILTTRNSPKDQQPHDYFVNLAKRSPKVPANKLTSYERDHGHEQFGNNFFMLFSERQRVERDPNVNKEWLVYITNAEEKYGSRWQEFVKRNSGLIHKIDEGLDRLGPYEELLQHHIDLLKEGGRKGDYSESEAFEALDIEGVGIYVWRPLNQLLKKVADQMKKEGINPKDFFA